MVFPKVQGRRMVLKSDGASSNVVGIVCPLIEIRSIDLSRLEGGENPPPFSTALHMVIHGVESKFSTLYFQE